MKNLVHLKSKWFTPHFNAWIFEFLNFWIFKTLNLRIFNLWIIKILNLLIFEPWTFECLNIWISEFLFLWNFESSYWFLTHFKRKIHSCKKRHNNNSQILFPLLSRHHPPFKMRLLLLALGLLVSLIACSPLHKKSSDKTEVSANKLDEVQQKEKRCKYIYLLWE